MNDVHLAFRSLLRNPGLVVVALLTLTLGIGATTAVFSVVDAVLFRTLGFEDPDRLVRVFATKPSQQIERAGLAGLDFLDFREQLESFEWLEAYRWFGLSLGEERPRELQTVLVTPGLLTALTPPLHGRGFRPAEGFEFHQGDSSSDSQVVVLSHGFFQRELGGDPQALGRELILDGEPHRVVGVMPPDFDFPAPGIELWAPWSFDPARLNRSGHWFNVLGKLRPGVSLEQANAELVTLARALEQQYPDSNEGWSAVAIPAQEALVGRVRPALMSLLVAVFLVLLIACANVANLLLARGLTRQGELALRSSLGAGRGRLVRQLLTESLVLSLFGGVLGVGLARLGIGALVASAPEDLPRIHEIGIDLRVLAFAFGLTVVTGLVFGLVPALRLTGGGLARAIQDGGRGSDAAARSRLRTGLAVTQLALSLLLLIGAGLMLRSFSRLMDVDPGFRAERRLAIQLFVYGDRYQEPESQRLFFERLFEELRAVPGVRSVAGVNSLPMGQLGSGSSPIRVEGRVEEEDVQPGNRIATRDYFATMGMRLVAGRAFESEDHAEAVPVTVLNESAVRQFFRDGSPLGARLFVGSNEEPHTVIGVVSDVRFQGMDQEPAPELFFPFEQRVTGTLSVVVETEGPPEALQTTLEDRVWRVDPAQPIWRTVTLETLVEQDTAQSQFYARLLSIFATVALALAAIGLYGVIAYSVVQRRREIGIRMAVGARSRDILGGVVRDGSLLVAIGLGIGLLAGGALTVALSRTLTGLLFEVRPTDPGTFVGVSGVLVVVGLLASVVPALRAARVDPASVLQDR